jgi:hypothetical protein
MTMTKQAQTRFDIAVDAMKEAAGSIIGSGEPYAKQVELLDESFDQFEDYVTRL